MTASVSGGWIGCPGKPWASLPSTVVTSFVVPAPRFQNVRRQRSDFSVPVSVLVVPDAPHGKAADAEHEEEDERLEAAVRPRREEARDDVDDGGNGGDRNHNREATDGRIDVPHEDVM